MNIIDGLQKRHIKVVETLITSLGWLMLLGYLFQILLCVCLWLFNLSNFYKNLFILGNIKSTLITLLITFIISICSFIIMYLWGFYNYKKFAHLNRRKFPSDVTSDDIAGYFNLPPDLVSKMQNDKVIVLEKTIV